MTKNTLWTVLAVVGAIVIAWILVDVVLGLVWFLGKLLLVAVVAVIVYGVIRLAARSSE